MAKEKFTLKEALELIEKKHGKGAIMRLTKGEMLVPVDVIKTGVYSIDRILGGGLARGRVCEIYGGAGSGKTTLVIQAIVNAQAAGLKVAYIDTEHAFDMNYAQQLGVKIEDLFFSQPDNAQQVFDIVRTLLLTNEFALIVIDSIAMMSMDQDTEGEIGKEQMGHTARFLTVALKQITSIIGKSNCALVCINQVRANLSPWGDAETSPGGMALKHAVSQRVYLKRSTKIEDKDGTTIGYTTNIKLVKNKIAAPFQTTKVSLIHGKGFDRLSDLFDEGLRMGIITKDKITYSIGKTKLGVGEAKAKEALAENEELQAEVVKHLDKLFQPNEKDTK